MGKENELWDDSALLDAFDNAMSKYKKMHGKKNSESNVSDFVHQSSDETIKDAGESSNTTVITGTESEEAMDLEPVNENHTVKLKTPEPCIGSSTSMLMQDKQVGNNGYSDSQAAQDDNQLLSRYYEVEEKRQMVLQQLQQFGNSNYQYSAEGFSTAAQWGTSCTSQEPIPTNQASQSAVICSCCPCPYACQSWVTPCTSYPCCSLAGTSIGKNITEPNDVMTNRNLPTVIDSDIIKTAMGAAERAISSMTVQASIHPDVNDENKEKKDGEEEMNQSTRSCETDLTVLLNAWYSAGFHTGKYLVEQNIAKKRQ